MRSNRSLAKAQKLVERYNRESEQIEALENRLYRLREKHSATRNAAFAALPDDCGITMHRTEPWEVEDHRPTPGIAYFKPGRGSAS